MQPIFDKIIVVSCSPEAQMKRALERDRLTPEEIKNRLGSQTPLPEKIKGADIVIDNSGTLADLEKAVTKSLEHLT